MDSFKGFQEILQPLQKIITSQICSHSVATISQSFFESSELVLITDLRTLWMCILCSVLANISHAWETRTKILWHRCDDHRDIYLSSSTKGRSIIRRGWYIGSVWSSWCYMDAIFRYWIGSGLTHPSRQFIMCSCSAAAMSLNSWIRGVLIVDRLIVVFCPGGIDSTHVK